MGLNLGDESVGTYGNGTYGDNSSAHMDELISGKKSKIISISSFTSRLCCILFHLITMCITFPMLQRSGRGSGRGESGGIIILSGIL